MFKKLSSKTISIICSICVLMSVCAVGLAFNTVADAESTTPTVKEISLMDVGHTNLNKYGEILGEYQDGFNNTNFGFLMKTDYNSGQATKIYFGGTGKRTTNGLFLTFSSNSADSDEFLAISGPGITSTTLTRSNFAANGVTRFRSKTAYIRYNITTKHVALDADNTVNDIQFEIYIDGVKVATVNAKDKLNEYGNWVYGFGASGSNALELNNYYTVTAKPLEEYEEWSLADAGCGSERTSPASDWLKSEYYRDASVAKSLDGAVFKFDADFDQTTSSSILVLSKFSGILQAMGVRIDHSKDTISTTFSHDWIKHKEYKPADFGLTSFHNTPLTIALYTRKIKDNGDGTMLVELILEVNGKVAPNPSYYNKTKPENFLRCVNMCGTVATYYNHDRYDELSLTDLGIDVQRHSVAVYGDKLKAESLNRLAISQTFAFSKNSKIVFGGKDTGFVFKALDNGNIDISYVKADKSTVNVGVINAEKAGITLDERSFYRITFDISNSGEATIKVYIDGVLYDYKPFTVTGVATDLMRVVNVVPASGGNITVAERDYLIASYGEFTGNKVINFKDTDDTKVPNEKKMKKYKVPNAAKLHSLWANIDNETIDGTIVRAIITAPATIENPCIITFGGVRNWKGNGIRFQIHDKKFVIEHLLQDTNPVVYASKVTIDTTTSIAGKTFVLELKCDAFTDDGKNYSYVLTPTIDGVPICDPIPVNDVPEYSVKERYVSTVYRDFVFNVDFESFGLTENWKQTLGIN